LIVLPFFHSFGLHAGILCCLMKGATIVPLQVFEPAATMQLITAERITAFPGAPAIYQAMLNHPDVDSFDLSSLRLAILGAAAIPVELIERMRGRLGIECVVSGFGITESSGIVSMCRYDDSPDVIAHTCGRPLPGLEVRLVDDEGNTVATDTPGEILVRGYALMRGYLDDPEQTAAAIDVEGWLHTGDVGVMRADGNLVITDRKKDMFVVGGFNVYPAEIENIMSTHPAIGQIAVVGMPDARLGEVGIAYVVARPGVDADPEVILAWCRDQMANYKVPRVIELVDALPLNASGKVLKYELREQAAQRAR
jgi:acyl-CoA synthetase (AMP-forming)/AMP-acid ligase II